MAQTLNIDRATNDNISLKKVSVSIKGSVDLTTYQSIVLFRDIFGENPDQEAFSNAESFTNLLDTTIKGSRHPVSTNVIVPKLPKVGDTIEIEWSTPAVKITIKGKVTAIDEDAFCTIFVKEIKGEYKGVIANLEGVDTSSPINLTLAP